MNKVSRFDGRKSFRSIPRAQKLILNNVSGFPDILMIKMKYTSLLHPAPAANTYHYVWRGNGAFDPGFTAGTDRPLGWDQWDEFYLRYRVFGVAYRIDTGFEAMTSYCHMVLFPAVVTSAPVNMTEAIEQPRSKYLGLHEVASRGAHHNTGYWSTSEVLGIEQERVRLDDTLASAISTTPNNQWYIHLFMATADTTVNVTASVKLELIYYLQFEQRVYVTQSA